jgi:amidase
MKRQTHRMSRRSFVRSSAHVGTALTLPLLRPHVLSAQTLTSDITAMSASQLSASIRERRVSCREVMRAYLERIERYNPTYNAIVSRVPDDELLAQAERADAALARGDYWGWMHGMPHAVKNLSNVRGLETTQGSPIYAGNIASEDTLFVERLRAAGAIFIGKTNTPEFGWGSQSYNPVHGTTKNAYDPDLTSGGSSGGAATGMATQMLPIADGSDMMGSLRNPAGFNNVIGFRPSQGRVPRAGDDVFYTQLSTHGPMGRNVEDTIRLLHTMAGFDARAPMSLRDEIPPFSEFRAEDLANVRIGWMGDYEGYLATEPGVMALCERGVDALTEHGAVVENCLPEYDMDRLWQTWLTLRHWSAGRDRALYDNPETRNLLKPEAVWEIEGSIDMPASQVAEAAVARSEWHAALNALFERYDVLALPTAQVFPFPADVHWPTEINGRAMDTYHRWMEVVIGGSLGAVPIVNVPVGFDERGRPMGVQVMGPVGRDREVLEFAMAYERVTDHLERRPRLVDQA